MARGTPMASSSVSSQSRVSRFISMVRLALVTSVTCRPVRFQISQVSMVPNSTSPASARARAPWRIVQQPADLRAGEIGRQRQAARGPGTGPGPPRRPARAPGRSVRVSCQTMALCTGLPVARSHRTVVSRWLVMPTAARSLGLDPRLGQRALGDLRDIGPDLSRVVLDPAGAREDLFVFLLVDGDDLALGVEDDAAGRGGALVDGGDVFAHRFRPPPSGPPCPPGRRLRDRRAPRRPRPGERCD